MQGIDLEMGERGIGEGGRSANPLHEKKLERGDSTRGDFEQHLKDTATAVAEKGLKAEGADAREAMNTDALAKLMDGGGVPLERLNIAINYLQNFGLVLVIDIPWPEVRRSCCGGKGVKDLTLRLVSAQSFKKWWTWVEALGLDFNVFGGMGEDVSIALGFLVPAWLIWEFDAGLFWERTYFGFFWMGKKGDNFKEYNSDFRGGLKGFAALGLVAIIFVALTFASVVAGWISNDLANAFLLVLSGLSLLSFLHQVYLWRETKVCELANEDFAKKRQENQMFFFLFFYTVTYLSGGESSSWEENCLVVS